MVHTWTNYCAVQPLPNKKKASLINALKAILLEQPFRTVRIIISDGEAGFLSKNVKDEVQKTLGNNYKTIFFYLFIICYVKVSGFMQSRK